jgi:hypothetical protein
MAITAQNYFQLAFDKYPIAWDESPFLYRALNFARRKVALDLNITTREEFDLSTKPTSLTLSQNFLSVKRVYFKAKNYSFLMTRKPNNFQPFKYFWKPVNYVLKAPNTILLLPTDYYYSDGDKIIVDYVPWLSELTSLSAEENYLPEIAIEPVALQICAKLAENDLQYGAKAYFENEYKLKIMELIRGAF